MIEMGKKYQTRDGRAVRILCVDGPLTHAPVVGVVDGIVEPGLWTKTGTYVVARESFSSDADLIPVPTKHEGWACMRMRSVTPETVCIADGLVFISEAEARRYGDEMLTDGYVVAHVTWEDS